MFSYAQNYEDVYIFRAFREVPDGFYIDVGAYDPVEDSVTKIFYDKGWSGINVEPGPIFDKLKRYRPRDINVQVAITDRTGEMDFYLHEREPGTSTLARQLDPHLLERIPGRHKSRVRVTTLSALIDTYAPGRHIHFLKLDAEGAEEFIIKSTDWRKYRPELLVVEATAPYSHERRDEIWSATLQAAGYSLVFFDGINVYYLRKESAFRRDAFGLPVNVLDFVKKYDYQLEYVGELEDEVAELKSEIATLRFERERLMRRIKLAGTLAGRPDLLASRALRMLRLMAKAARDFLRAHIAPPVRRFNTRMLAKYRRMRSADAFQGHLDDALLTLELRAHQRLPRYVKDRRWLARIAETRLRRFALHKVT